MGLKGVNYNHKRFDSVEVRASNLLYGDAITFLKKKCDGLLSTTEAMMWIRAIVTDHPDSKLALSHKEHHQAIAQKRRRRIRNVIQTPIPVIPVIPRITIHSLLQIPG
jgi:hypothetical protein